jgi:UDP-N-acetylglucosamine:LPS N-acetylglucosamine transferase
MKLLKTISLYFVMLTTVFAGSLAAHADIRELPAPKQPKKKILFLMSNGGAAHKSMLKALTTYLQDDYELSSFRPIECIWTQKDISYDQLDSLLENSLSVKLFGLLEIPVSVKLKNMIAQMSAVTNLLSKQVAEAHEDSHNPLIKNLLELNKKIRSYIARAQDGDEVYNYVINENAYDVANFFYPQLVNSLFVNHAAVVERFEKKFEELKPDLVVSLIPLFNAAALEAASNENIPFLLLAPDFDISNYFVGHKVQLPCPTTIPFNDETLVTKATGTGLDPADLKLYGMPLRKDFFEQKNAIKIKEQLKKEKEPIIIPDNKKVIMILMGGAGSKKVSWYVQQVIKATEMGAITEPVHILACVGRDKVLANKLKRDIKLPDNGNVSISVIGFTERISDLMAVSDMLITKPGPATLCEAIQSKLPVILDASSGVLDWERAHIDFVKRHELGLIVEEGMDPVDVISTMISDPQYLNEIKEHMASLARGKEYVGQMKSLIKNLMTEPEHKKPSPSWKKIASKAWHSIF